MEQFECLDCFHTGKLNVHGKCEACNSTAVFSTQQVRSFEAEMLMDLFTNEELATLFGMLIPKVGEA